MTLPAGWPAFALLLFLPGFSLLTLVKRRLTMVELAAIPVTLSIILFPLAVLIMSPVSMHEAPALLGLATAGIATYQYIRGTSIKVERSGALPLLIGAVLFFVVLFVSLKTFRLTDGGMVHGFTHGMDLNFHLSISKRFAVAPHMPPEDPYLPGYYIPYNWFMHVLFGGLSSATGIELLAVFKALVPAASALIFLDAYLLARLAFNGPAALTGSLLYVLGSGLSWLLVLFHWNGTRLDLFKCLVYERPGYMNLKYDSTALYFFLPQTQLFGLLAMVFGLYLFALAVKKKSPGISAIAGLSLASLVFFHLINAFPVFIALGLFSVYLIVKERNMRAALVLLLPLLIGGAAVLYQYTLFPVNSGSQVALGQHKDLPVTLLLSLGPLLPFGAYGIYRRLDDDVAKLLAFFALINIAAVSVLVMDLTGNTYRFLTYLSLPVSLFAGWVFARWLVSPKPFKMATVFAVILLMVPSTVLIADFYNNNKVETLATAPEVKAITWLGQNVPLDAIIFEKPTYFVKVPVIAGRDVAYAGQAYTKQYHGVVHQDRMDRILGATDPGSVSKALANDGVDYVFVGRRESKYPYVRALDDGRYFKKVYDEDGVKIYEVLNS
jgi:hypothetical protein